MKYTTVTGNLQQLRTPCLITGLKTAKRIARALGEQQHFNRSSKDFDDAPGKSLCVHLDGAIARILVLGGMDNPSAAVFTKTANLAAQEAIKLPIGQAVIALSDTRVKGKNTQWKASFISVKPAKPGTTSQATLTLYIYRAEAGSRPVKGLWQFSKSTKLRALRATSHTHTG